MFVALTADFISPYGLNTTAEEIAGKPSAAHWFGTDALRKDVLTRVLHGSRLSLLAGLSSIALALGIQCRWVCRSPGFLGRQNRRAADAGGGCCADLSQHSYCCCVLPRFNLGGVR